jgi:hypothetical protein
MRKGLKGIQIRHQQNQNQNLVGSKHRTSKLLSWKDVHVRILMWFVDGVSNLRELIYLKRTQP